MTQAAQVTLKGFFDEHEEIRGLWATVGPIERDLLAVAKEDRKKNTNMLDVYLDELKFPKDSNDSNLRFFLTVRLHAILDQQQTGLKSVLKDILKDILQDEQKMEQNLDGFYSGKSFELNDFVYPDEIKLRKFKKAVKSMNTMLFGSHCAVVGENGDSLIPGDVIKIISNYVGKMPNADFDSVVKECKKNRDKDGSKFKGEYKGVPIETFVAVARPVIQTRFQYLGLAYKILKEARNDNGDIDKDINKDVNKDLTTKKNSNDNQNAEPQLSESDINDNSSEIVSKIVLSLLEVDKYLHSILLKYLNPTRIEKLNFGDWRKSVLVESRHCSKASVSNIGSFIFDFKLPYVAGLQGEILTKLSGFNCHGYIRMIDLYPTGSNNKYIDYPIAHFIICCQVSIINATNCIIKINRAFEDVLFLSPLFKTGKKKMIDSTHSTHLIDFKYKETSIGSYCRMHIMPHSIPQEKIDKCGIDGGSFFAAQSETPIFDSIDWIQFPVISSVADMGSIATHYSSLQVAFLEKMIEKLEE